MSRIKTNPTHPLMGRSRIFIIICLLIVILFHVQSSIQLDSCQPHKLETSFNRTDLWKYRNTVTGEWYHWNINFEKASATFSWPMKWLNKEPTSYLGVIIYLATARDTRELNQSFIEISRLFKMSGRPVVIFHEGDFDDEKIQLSLAQTLQAHIPLAFERIQFSNEYASMKLEHNFPISYLHMCRFFTLMIFNHPVMNLFSAFLRLDSHSYIFSPAMIDDPFELMEAKQLEYAFIMTNIESSRYDRGLWPFFERFLRRYCLKKSSTIKAIQTSLLGDYSEDIIFTNFALTNVSLWKENKLIQSFLNSIDLDGGIYRYRWGDAPIHTLTLAQFVDPSKIARLRYFGYWHRREYVCATGTTNRACDEQVAKYKNNTNIKYLLYQDGCFRPRRKICHYYQEIN